MAWYCWAMIPCLHMKVYIIQNITAFGPDLLWLKLPTPMTKTLLPGLRRTVWKSLLWDNLCLITQSLNTCMFFSVNRDWITVLCYLRVTCHFMYSRWYSRIYNFSKERIKWPPCLSDPRLHFTRHNILMCTIWKTFC